MPQADRFHATAVLFTAPLDWALEPAGLDSQPGRHALVSQFALALACAALAPMHAHAAELRPYSLPSQQQQQQMVRPVEPPPQQQAPIQAAPMRLPNAQYYQNYARWARTLQPAQRAELARGFERDAKRAFEAGNHDEAQHYLRLVSILRARR